MHIPHTPRDYTIAPSSQYTQGMRTHRFGRPTSIGIIIILSFIAWVLVVWKLVDLYKLL